MTKSDLLNTTGRPIVASNGGVQEVDIEELDSANTRASWAPSERSRAVSRARANSDWNQLHQEARRGAGGGADGRARRRTRPPRRRLLAFTTPPSSAD